MKHPLHRSLAPVVALLGSIALSACGGSGDCSGPLCGGGSTGPTSSPPGAPGNVSLTVSGTTITVTWSAGSGATSHRVSLATTGEQTRTSTVSGSATSAAFDGLTQTKTYTGQVIAVNSDGETAGGSAQATVPAITGAVRARVRADGDPISGYPVDLLDLASDSLHEAHTDSTGVIIFRDLEPGAYEVYVSPTLDFFSFSEASHTLDVEAGVLSDALFAGTTAISELALGTAVAGLSGTARSLKWFVLPITVSAADASSGTLVVTLSGGTGDADLVVVDPNSVQAFSLGLTNTEVLEMAGVAGEWHVLLWGFHDFEGVTLSAALR